MVATVFGFALGVLLFSTLALLPPMLQNLMGYPVMTSGLVTMPRGIGTLLSMFGLLAMLLLVSVGVAQRQAQKTPLELARILVRELRPEDLAGSQGGYQLRMEILRRVNLVISPSKANAVLIEEMLVN